MSCDIVLMCILVLFSKYIRHIVTLHHMYIVGHTRVCACTRIIMSATNLNPIKDVRVQTLTHLSLIILLSLSSSESPSIIRPIDQLLHHRLLVFALSGPPIDVAMFPGTMKGFIDTL